MPVTVLDVNWRLTMDDESNININYLYYDSVRMLKYFILYYYKINCRQDHHPVRIIDFHCSDCDRGDPPGNDIFYTFFGFINYFLEKANIDTP